MIGRALDFSESDSAYEEKNRDFFSRLQAADHGTTLILYTEEGNGYYDLLAIAGEPKLEAIPVPVFMEVTKLREPLVDFMEEYFHIVERSRYDWSDLDDSDRMIA